MRKNKTYSETNNEIQYKMTIQFTKMQGAGNDYIYVNTINQPVTNPKELAIQWSTYHTGIGSDGLVLIGPSHIADFSMRIFNADGSEAKMCGNASRCIGKYLYDKKLTQKKQISLETLSGIKHLELHVKNGAVKEVTVDMGCPEILEESLNLSCPNGTFTGTFVSMGNPHFVTFVEDIKQANLPVTGPLLEHHPYFPDRANIEFVQFLSEGNARMRVWERGSGITQACGTGACASAVALIAHGRAQKGDKIQIQMDGGTLTIEWNPTDNHVYMTGNAVTVFEGSIKL